MWDYLCAWELQPCGVIQQSASSQGVPASLSDSYFPLAPARKIETVYEKWKKGGKCHLLSVTPPVSKKDIQTEHWATYLTQLRLYVKSAISILKFLKRTA